MYNKKVILQCLVKYWILFALIFVLQKSYWTRCHSSNTVSAERRLVQIKSKHCRITYYYHIYLSGPSNQKNVIIFFGHVYAHLDTKHIKLSNYHDLAVTDWTGPDWTGLGWAGLE